MPRSEIEEPGLSPKEKVRRLVERIEPLRNTIQYSWLLELARTFFDFPADEDLTPANWESLYDVAARKMAEPNWEQHVLDRTKIDSVFLTNNFDDPLEGFDTTRYIPCLRTDDLVFHLSKNDVRERLQRATSTNIHDADSLRTAVGELFQHFTAKGARACAISLPPGFALVSISKGEANEALDTVLRGVDSIYLQEDRSFEKDVITCANFVFWMLAEFCDEFRLPFDLMIGVNRTVYRAGVYQGRDLFDSRVSLIQYQELLNAFPRVMFPISVLASVTNQELVSYAWIFPNVVTNGHWWYSNTPAFIEHDAAARLEAVPQSKQIGYYSDAYKLEFIFPKFAMYKRILAKILAERFVIERGWTETATVDLGKRVLRGNVEQIFNMR